jgi:hypothetical protein
VDSRVISYANEEKHQQWKRDDELDHRRSRAGLRGTTWGISKPARSREKHVWVVREAGLLNSRSGHKLAFFFQARERQFLPNGYFLL